MWNIIESQGPYKAARSHPEIAEIMIRTYQYFHSLLMTKVATMNQERILEHRPKVKTMILTGKSPRICILKVYLPL